MPSSSSRGRPRTQLGAPAFPVSAPAAYLRHRAAAHRSHQARARSARRRRLAAISLFGALYLAIGHEVVQLTRARARLLGTEVRSELHAATHDLRNIIQLSRARTDPEALLATGQSHTGALDELGLEPPPAALHSAAPAQGAGGDGR